MNDASKYQTLVEEAEKAVASVKDPELKRIAFQKVLDTLLSDQQSVAKLTGRRNTSKGKSSKRSAGSVAKKSKSGPASYLGELVDEGFFKKPKTIAQVKAELENRGHHIPLTSLSGPLQKKCQSRELRRQKISTSGKKATFAYSDW